MSEDFLADRRKALEEAFFAKHNAQLLHQLHTQDAASSEKAALRAASGITDDAILDHLLAANIQSAALAALTLVPLVIVAWADGNVDAKERRAILDGAREAGLNDQDASYQLLASWLRHRPDATLLSAWKAYVKALDRTLSGEDVQALKQDIVGRARGVAEAAGGFLGLGSKISPAERTVLTEIEQSFS